MIRMLVRGGFGDIHSGLTRIKDIKSKYPNNEIFLYKECFENSYPIIRELLNKYRNLFYGIEYNLFGYDKPAKKLNMDTWDNDIILNDWRNVDNQFFEMEFPFYTSCFDLGPVEEGVTRLGVHMMTLYGDMDYADQGGYNMKRFWPKAKWINYLKEMSKKYDELIIFGSEREDYGINFENLGFNKLRNLIGHSLDETLFWTQKCNLFVGVNSWIWQVSGYAGINTNVLYFTNPFWIENHCSKDMMKNISIFTDRDITVDALLACSEGVKC